MPGSSRLVNLSLRSKLALVVGVLAAPVLVLAGIQFTQQQETISRTASEEAGLAYLNEAVFPLITRLELHRTLAGVAAGGDSAVASQLETAASDVDSAFAR